MDNDTGYQPSKHVAEHFGFERDVLRKYAGRGLVKSEIKSRELYVSVEDTAHLAKGIKGRRVLDSVIKTMYLLQREEVKIEDLPMVLGLSKDDQADLVEPALWLYSYERNRYIAGYGLNGKESEFLLIGEVLDRLGISCKNVIYHLISEHYLAGYEPKKNRAENGVKFIIFDSWLEYIGKRKGKPLFDSEKALDAVSKIEPGIRITPQKLCDIARENKVGFKISPKKRMSTFLFTPGEIYNLANLALNA